MADDEDSGLFAIDVDADDYAETAAGDTPSTVPRTFQSEEDFAKQKASYTAKSNADNFEELLKAVPVLSSTAASNRTPRSRLGKKDAQLLGYVVGEFYYNRRYEEIIQLCHLVRQCCEVDPKTVSSMTRWVDRCQTRLSNTG